EAGRNAADWWGQYTVGGRTTGDVRLAARRILTGIDDGDPQVLFALPGCDRTDAALHLPDVIDTHGAPDTPESPTGDELADALAAYADAYDAAAEARVVELCHLAASPTGTDLTHLHPDRVGIDAVGVFSGEWAATDDGDRYASGYVGTLIGRWNGWAVFTCTRQVADAIVADHEQQRRQLRDDLRDAGIAEAQLDHAVDAELARLTFDGDVLVADLSVLQDDPEAIARVHPDRNGQYDVMGRIWCWEAVDPYACDRIVGDIPAPDGEPESVLLRHTPGMRVPHDRIRLTPLQHSATNGGLAFSGEVTLDGIRFATVSNDGNGGGTQLSDPDPLPGGREDWRAYLAGCRYHGAPVSEQRLLDALTDEYYLDVAVSHAAAEGGTQVRLIDDSGHTRALRPIFDAPRDFPDLLRCATEVVGDDWPAPAGRTWQVWTGTAWIPVPAPRPYA
ncbi:MAG TPA: hypothetical protein VF755_21990, partial [Catenuloplanes sp.]